MADLSALSDAAEPGPWEYRPREFDDWGLIRGSREVFGDGDGGPPVANSKPRWDDYNFDAHRAAGTDPMEANGRFIVELVNAYREGRLVEARGQSKEDQGDDNWQTVDTAPKDGTMIEAQNHRGNAAKVYRTYWGVGKPHDLDGDTGMAQSAYVVNGGSPWWLNPDGFKMAPRPTHWRHLSTSQSKEDRGDG